MFALVDCNNFYASCERVFRPELEGRPVVVLSNNDGFIISRSNEAKALDIPMVAAYYKIEAQVFIRLIPRFQCNIGLHNLANCFIGNTDYSNFGNRFVFKQCTFNLEGANQVTRAFDYVV